MRRQAEHPAVRSPSGIPGLAGPDGRSLAGVAGTLLLLHAALVILFTLLRRSWPAFNALVGANTAQAYVIGAIFMQGLLILAPTVLVILAGRIPTADLVGTRPRAGSLVLAATAGVPAAVVFQGLNNLLIYILVRSGVSLPEPAAASGLAGDNLFDRPWMVIALVILISVVMPGLIEELMFRGVVLSSLRSAGAAASAIFWQAAAFAVFHGDPLFILPPFLAGLMLAGIRQRSESLFPAMAAHMSLNLSLLAVTPLLPRLTVKLLAEGSSQANSLLYASLIAACVAAVALVPLLILISHLQAAPEKHRTRLHVWPADWKFALAFAALIAIMILDNY